MSGRRLIGCAVCALALSVPQAHAATTTFTTAGEHAFTVPAGVTRVHIETVGGRGGDAGTGVNAVAGSFGGTASADVAVSPGQVLYAEVGGNGTSPNTSAGGGAGANGGGAGAGRGSGGGGGASDVRTSPNSVALTDSDTRLIVAGGGGGAGVGPANGSSGVGVSGGEGGGIAGAAADGQSGPYCRAGGGTQSAGGSTPEPGGHAGSLGQGGAAGSGFSSQGGSGGGGGGYYGGGSGPLGLNCSGVGGGGGGSGYFGAGTSNPSFGTDSTGIPSVAITAADPPSVQLTGPTDGATYDLHQGVTAAYACTAAANTTISVCSGTVASNAAIDTSTPGRYAFSVIAGDADGGTTTVVATYTVRDPELPSVSLAGPADGATYALHQRVLAAYTCKAAAGTTITSCSGTVPNGTPIDTSTAGRYAFRVTTLDADGGTATAVATYTVLAPPKLTAKVTGTSLTFTLDRPATVTLTFSRLTRGRKPSPAGKLSVSGHAGSNRRKLAGGRKLKPGSYTVAITARDSLGQVSKRRTLRFTIAR